MKSITENMLSLQKLVQQGSNLTAERLEAIRLLRTDLPAPVLAHFDRMLAQGRTGVALVRHGVCCGCHMRLPTSMVADLKNTHDVWVCENCGSYLLQAPDESADVAVAPAVVAGPVRKTRKQRVVVPA